MAEKYELNLPEYEYDRYAHFCETANTLRNIFTFSESFSTIDPSLQFQFPNHRLAFPPDLIEVLVPRVSHRDVQIC